MNARMLEIHGGTSWPITTW